MTIPPDTDQVLKIRDEMSNLFHMNQPLVTSMEHSGFPSEDQYLAFCIAKDWLQDTGEALLRHRKRGFSKDPLIAYIEFWGVLQAVFIQQDALAEMQYAFLGQRQLKKEVLNGPAWRKIRELRNLVSGHPAFKDRGHPSDVSSLTSRERKSYSSIQLKTLHRGGCGPQRGSEWSEINLGKLINEYDAEATPVLFSFLEQLRETLQTPEEGG